MNSRNRTPSEYVGYGLYLYFSGLFPEKDSTERISHFVRRNHDVSIWNWVQKYNPRKISVRRRKISGYIIVDETLVKVGSESIWLWVAIESKTKRILALSMSKERNMLVWQRRDLLLMWSRLMENVQQFQLMVEPGTLLKPVDS